MKKVIALIGSRAGCSSNTKKLCDDYINALQGYFDEEIVSEVLTADTWHINSCLSCSSCFQRGYCIQDNRDGMSRIKDKILSSDIIILGTPVFAGNVSGDMKTMIDRLSLWLHIMPLIGKIGIPLCTASNNHSDRVIEYLTEIMEDMGASIPTDVTAFRYKGTVLLKEEENLKEFLKKKAVLTHAAFCHGFKFSNKQEIYFNYQNKTYAKHLKFMELYPSLSGNLSEAKLWKEMGYDKCKSIYEVLSVIDK